MSFNQPITVDEGWFTGEDRIVQTIIYEAGTTLEDALADTGVRQDITGWNIRWTMRARRDSSDSIIDRLVNIIGDPLDGVVQVVVEHADTTELEAGTYWHTFARVDAGSQGVLTFGGVAIAQAAVR